MSRKSWKPRIGDILKSIDKIERFCAELRSAEELAGDEKTYDACIRNLQVLGDASKHIPAAVQKKFSAIPWKEMAGLRNVVVHEYFGTSPEIIWRTIRNDLPKLRSEIQTLLAAVSTPVDKFKVCPPGEIFVRSSLVEEHLRSGSAVDAHFRASHCREVEDPLANILNASEIKFVSSRFLDKAVGSIELPYMGMNERDHIYDQLIIGWTDYWNRVLEAMPPLEPSVVKALLVSESSLHPKAKASGKNPARGLAQLMPLTIKALGGFRMELKDHLILIEPDDIFDPAVSISAGIRWLHQKRVTATRRLKRQATWEEAVAEYKHYLVDRSRSPKKYEKGMRPFLDLLKEIKK